MARVFIAWAVLLLMAGCGEGAEPNTNANTNTNANPLPAPEPVEQVAEKPREFLPRLTDAHLPPLLAGLAPGTSTVQDVISRFPDLQTDKDKSLGGTMIVQYNGRPAVALRLPYKVKSGPRGRPDGIEDLSLYLVPDEAGVPRIRSMRLVLDTGDEETLCEWLHRVVGSDPEAKVCPGSNRSLGRIGKSGDAGTYCIGTADGSARILVECSTTSQGLSEIQYDLL